MYRIKYTKKFKKDLKRLRDNEKVLHDLGLVLNSLVQGKTLDTKFLNHKLHGDLDGYFECHLRLDLLLIYEIVDNELLVLCLRIGSHSELF